MAEILGVSLAEMIGQPSSTYVFDTDIEAAQRLFTAKQQGDRRPFTFRLRRKDGYAVWVNVENTPMFNERGEFEGIAGVFTERSKPKTWPAD